MASSFSTNPRFIESIRNEPKKLLLPISGYEKVDVKSLEDACEPIKHLFDQKLNNYITVAKINSTEPEDGLSTDESASIHLYTIEWDVHENSLYMLLNQTLRLADRTKLRPWFKYLKLFLTAFFKLPPSEHTLVWRGVRENLSAVYPMGKEFAWWAISSCTATINVLESSSYLGKSGARTMFSIQTNNGKLIRAHSYFDNEDEILLPPGMYFKVIGILNPAEGLHIIQLCEIPPPYPMLAEPFDLKQLKQTLPQSKSPSNISKPTEIQENYSTSAVPKPLKPQSTTPNKKSSYSDKKLYCKGRACAKCGYCRDWYWRPDGNYKHYTKRDDAQCTGRARRGGGYYYHDGYDYDSGYDSRRLCECENNCS